MIISIVVIVPLVLGVGTAIWSYSLGSSEWWRSYLQNISAGFIGLALATLIAYIIARVLAKRALQAVAPTIINLIKTLREKGKIDGDIARALVITAVTILRETNVIAMRSEVCGEHKGTKCTVCGLEVESGPCKHCLLPEAIWKV